MKYVPNNRGKSVLFGKDGLPLTYDEYNTLYQNRTSYTGEYPNWNLTSSGIVQNQENYKPADPLLKGVWESNQNYINSGNVTKDIQSYYDFDNKTWGTAQDFVNAYNADAEKIRSTWNTDHAWEATGAKAHNQLHRKMFGSRNSGTYNASTGTLGYDTKHEDNFGTTTFYRRMDRYDGEYETLTPEQRKARTHTINTPSGPVQVFKKANGDLLLLDSNNEPVKAVNPNNPAEVSTEAEKVAAENPATGTTPATGDSPNNASPVVPHVPLFPGDYDAMSGYDKTKEIAAPDPQRIYNWGKWIPVADSIQQRINNGVIYDNAVKSAQLTPNEVYTPHVFKAYAPYNQIASTQQAQRENRAAGWNAVENNADINSAMQLAGAINETDTKYQAGINDLYTQANANNTNLAESIDAINKTNFDNVANINNQNHVAAQLGILNARSQKSMLDTQSDQSRRHGVYLAQEREDNKNAINQVMAERKKYEATKYNLGLRDQYLTEQLEEAQNNPAAWNFMRNAMANDFSLREAAGLQDVEVQDLTPAQLQSAYQTVAADHPELVKQFEFAFKPIIDKMKENTDLYNETQMNQSLYGNPYLKGRSFLGLHYRDLTKPTDYTQFQKTGGTIQPKKIKSEREMWLDFLKAAEVERKTKQDASTNSEKILQAQTKLVLDNLSKEELVLLKSVFK